MAEWRSQEHLLDHFEQHRHEFPDSSVTEYDASAQETLAIGTYFEFFDDGAGESRVGCFDRWAARLTILDEDGEIVSHFRCRETYALGLPFSNYDATEET
jgi:hypothetical protein